MKRLFSWLVVMLTAVFVLVGCGGQTAVSPEVEEEVAVDEPLVEADTAVSNSDHNPYDLTLITNTGKPQFLNAYASW